MNLPYLDPSYHGVRVGAVRPKDSALKVFDGVKSALKPGHIVQIGHLKIGDSTVRFKRYAHRYLAVYEPWELSSGSGMRLINQYLNRRQP